MKPTSILLGVCTCLLLVGAATSAADSDRLVFRAQGYSINPPSIGGAIPTQSLMLFLPASDGFAPNVNVQIQAFAGTLEEYSELSKKQFQEAKVDLIKMPEVAKGIVTFEYQGDFQGRQTHWYSKAFKSGDRVYLATATALSEQWTTSGPKLKTSVDSFGPTAK